MAEQLQRQPCGGVCVALRGRGGDFTEPPEPLQRPQRPVQAIAESAVFRWGAGGRG